MKIYFAGSIRGGRDDKEFYHRIIKLIGQYGQVLTEHIGDRDLSTEGETTLSESEIYARDIAWIREADALIAEVSSPSLGVGYEIAQAEGHKPILCLYRKDSPKQLSAMIQGNDRLTILTYSKLAEVEQGLSEFFAENFS